MSRFEYQWVDINSIAGIERAERLQARGWRIIQSGFFRVLMEREVVRPRLVNH